MFPKTTNLRFGSFSNPERNASGLIQERSYSSTVKGYRYGFNGQESDNEVSGNGNQYDYGFRIYNPRLGKFLSVDPLTSTFPSLTPYQFAANMPIAAIDLDGLEAVMKINSVTVSREFLKITTEEGIECGLEYLKFWMNKCHTVDGEDWVGTITNGVGNEEVIVVADIPGLPEELIVYSLEYTGPRTAEFTENRFHIPGIIEADERNRWERVVDWVAERLGMPDPPYGGPTRKTRRANWFDDMMKEYFNLEDLVEYKKIKSWTSGSPPTVEYGDYSEIEIDDSDGPDETNESYLIQEKYDLPV